MQSESKTCQNCKQEFRIEPEDFAFYEKMRVPPPTWCPDCRLVRRLVWRNERTFYRRTCDKCGKSMISIYSPETGLTVYCSPCWWSDEWNSMDYGLDFDPSKPFILQVRELFQRVPVMNVHGLYTTLINSDYTHMVSHLKDCYMVTATDVGENLLYGSFITNSKDSVDNLILDQGELCYETANCSRSYKTLYSVDCEDCRNVYFSRNCVGCSDCFGCVNLRNKQYHIFNAPVSKEEFDAFVKEAFASRESIGEHRVKAEEFWNKFPRKFMHGSHNVNVSGDYIANSKNVRQSFIVSDLEDAKYCSLVTATRDGKMTDTYDFTSYGVYSSLLCDVLQAGNQVSNIRYSWWVITNTSDIEYAMFIINCQHIFGSVGLRKKEYCILNKQYSKEEYEALRATIMRHMDKTPYKDEKGRVYSYGEFFPPELSPFRYNETTAYDFFPLPKEEAAAKGYGWYDAGARDYKPTIAGEDLPSKIGDARDAVLKDTIACIHKGECMHNCTIAYKIIPQELAWYRRMEIPLPQCCPNCRHGVRILQRNPPLLWKRRCQCAGEKSDADIYVNAAAHFHDQDHCPNQFETSYSPDRPEIVYCEQCYQAEVV